MDGEVENYSLLVARLGAEPQSMHRAANLEGPEFFSWGRLEELIASLIDEVRIMQHLYRSANSGKRGGRSRFEQYPRPESKIVPETLDDSFDQLKGFFFM